MQPVCCNWGCKMCYCWECTDTQEVYDKCSRKVPVKEFWEDYNENEVIDKDMTVGEEE